MQEEVQETMEVETQPQHVPAVDSAEPAEPENVNMVENDTAAAPSAPTDPSQEVRVEAIYLTGVDDLSDKDVEKFVQSFYDKPFFQQWIDDRSVNVVYDDPEDAFQCLVAMTAESEFEKNSRIEPTQLRNTKPHPAKQLALQARFATEADKKVTGARERSRYYLMNGAPSRKQDVVRFGSKRSAPLKYGTQDIDLMGDRKPKSRSRGGDLFPSKVSKTTASSSSSSSSGRRRRGGRNRNRNRRDDEPDLFADKLAAAAERDAKKDAPSVYSNMDY